MLFCFVLHSRESFEKVNLQSTIQVPSPFFAPPPPSSSHRASSASSKWRRAGMPQADGGRGGGGGMSAVHPKGIKCKTDEKKHNSKTLGNNSSSNTGNLFFILLIWWGLVGVLKLVHFERPQKNFGSVEIFASSRSYSPNPSGHDLQRLFLKWFSLTAGQNIHIF